MNQIIFNLGVGNSIWLPPFISIDWKLSIKLFISHLVRFCVIQKLYSILFLFICIVPSACVYVVSVLPRAKYHVEFRYLGSIGNNANNANNRHLAFPTSNRIRSTRLWTQLWIPPAENNGTHQRSPAVRMQRCWGVSVLSLRASPGQSEVICGASSYPERHTPSSPPPLQHPPPKNAAPEQAYTWRRYAARKPIPALSGVVFDIRVPSVVSHLWNGGFAVTCRWVQADKSGGDGGGAPSHLSTYYI